VITHHNGKHVRTVLCEPCSFGRPEVQTPLPASSPSLSPKRADVFAKPPPWIGHMSRCRLNTPPTLRYPTCTQQAHQPRRISHRTGSSHCSQAYSKVRNIPTRIAIARESCRMPRLPLPNACANVPWPHLKIYYTRTYEMQSGVSSSVCIRSPAVSRFRFRGAATFARRVHPMRASIGKPLSRVPVPPACPTSRCLLAAATTAASCFSCI